MPPAAEEQPAEDPPPADAEQPADPPAAEQQAEPAAEEADAPAAAEAAAIPSAEEPAIDAAQAAAQAAAVAARLMASHGTVSGRHRGASPHLRCPEVGRRGFKACRGSRDHHFPPIRRSTLQPTRSTTTSGRARRRRARREVLTRREPLLAPWTAATAWGAPTPWPLGCVLPSRVWGKAGSASPSTLLRPAAHRTCGLSKAQPPPSAPSSTARVQARRAAWAHKAAGSSQPPGFGRATSVAAPPPLLHSPSQLLPCIHCRAPWRCWTSPPTWWAS